MALRKMGFGRLVRIRGSFGKEDTGSESNAFSPRLRRAAGVSLSLTLEILMPSCMNERLHTSLIFRRMALFEPGYVYEKR